ncbi:MAG: type II secretion system protein [Kiritimatiellia bacterium]
MNKRGFSLLELIVVMAVVGLLASLTLPTLVAAREKARVAKVKVELRQIELALESYYESHACYPPVRVSCNSSERDHWCQLPPELAQGGFLSGSLKKGLSSALEDPFNPGHTYKYAAIGPYSLNGARQEEYFALFLPDDFPFCQSQNGRYHDQAQAPLAWVVWSLGPRQSRKKALHARAPVSGFTWYRGVGDDGVIARIKPKEGSAYQTP